MVTQIIYTIVTLVVFAMQAYLAFGESFGS
jgi:hypothetical protein